MPPSITHIYVSPISDDPVAAATGEVLPSEWNAQHIVSGVRTIVMAAGLTFFVTLTGSDSNPGTNAQPWATCQHAAISVAQNYDSNGFAITVNVGPGSFVGFGSAPLIGGGSIFFNGAGYTQTTLLPGANDGIYNFGETFDLNLWGGSPYFLDFMTFKVGSVNCIANYTPGAVVVIGGNSPSSTIAFDVTSASFVTLVAGSGSGSIIFIGAGFTPTVSSVIVIGSATLSNILDTIGYAVIQNTSKWTWAGTLTFNEFVAAEAAEILEIPGSSYTGAVGIGSQSVFVTLGGFVGALFRPQGFLGPNFYPHGSAGIGFVDGSSGYDGFSGPITGVFGAGTVTLIIDYANGILEIDNSGLPATVTVPSDATLNFYIGTKFWITQVGTGSVTIVGAPGVTVHNAGTLSGQWATNKLYKRGPNEWVQTNA